MAPLLKLISFNSHRTPHRLREREGMRSTHVNLVKKNLITTCFWHSITRFQCYSPTRLLCHQMRFFHRQMDNSNGDEGGGGGCGKSMWESQQRQLLSIILFALKKMRKNEDTEFVSSNLLQTTWSRRKKTDKQINKMAKGIRITSQLLALSNVYFRNLHITQWVARQFKRMKTNGEKKPFIPNNAKERAAKNKSKPNKRKIGMVLCCSKRTSS